MLNATTPGVIVILLVTAAVSLYGLYGRPKLIAASLFQPYYFLRSKQYYTLLSSGVVHASVSHLFFNMMTFYFFGPPLERVIGTVSFVILYVLALILSEARTYIQHRDDPRYASLGASGAVSSVLFASIVYFPTQSILILPIPIPIPAILFAVGYLVYSSYLARQGNDGVNHTAHIDGAITGLLFVLVTNGDAYQRLFRILGY